MKLKKKVLVTIGREYGSGGKKIAEALGKDLGIPVYDKNLLKIIAEKHDIDADLLENDDENLSNPFFEPYFTYGIDTASRSSRLFSLQSRIIREKADKESAIFVGRCADDVLSDYDDVVSIFIYAPKDVRIKRIMRTEDIADSLAAEKILKRVDKARRSYYQFYTDRKWGTTDGHDLIINSACLGLKGTLEFIEDFLVRLGYVEP